MKFTDWIIIFIAIFICFTGIVFWGINQNRNSTVVNEEYANMLTIACEDTMKTSRTDRIKSGVWANETDRKRAVGTFYATLAYCMNNEYTAEEANHLFIPAIVLIDTDGYYISYNSALDSHGNVYIGTSSSGQEYCRWMDASNTLSEADADMNAFKEGVTLSPINTWTETYGTYTVRFHLSDVIDVMFTTNRNGQEKTEIVSGTKDDVGKEISRLKKEGIITDASLDGAASNRNTAEEKCTIRQLLYEAKKYDQEKNYVIVSQINNEVEYYINYHNVYAEANDIPYSYTMPEVSKEDWHRLLKNPTAIAFMQGRQMRTGKQFTNVYALSGGELVKQHKYFITKEGENYIYHYLYATNCPYYTMTCETQNRTVKYNGGKFGLDAGDPNTVYKEDNSYQIWYRTNKQTGVKVPISDLDDITQDLYDSMEECAKKGAYPCSCAINHNHTE